MTAAIYGRLEAATELIALGADLNAKDRILGYSALIWSSKDSPYPAACRSIYMVRLLIASGIDVNISGSGGWTALMSASFKGQFDVVKELIKAGADVDARDENGKTAEAYARKEGFDEVARYLQITKSLADAGLLRRQCGGDESCGRGN